MNALDIVLLIAMVSFAVSGYRQGFIVGMLSFAGFLGGGALAMYAWPRFVDVTRPVDLARMRRRRAPSDPDERRR